MRPIDADELKEEVKGMFCPDGYKLDFIKKIDNAPTVEYPFYQEAYQTGYEEGKNARPQGKWVTIPDRTYCSNCNYFEQHPLAQELMKKQNFCPNCGADMRGDKE